MKPLEFPAIGSHWADDEFTVRVSGYYWNQDDRWVEVCNVGHGFNTNRRLVRLEVFYAIYAEVKT